MKPYGAGHGKGMGYRSCKCKICKPRGIRPKRREADLKSAKKSIRKAAAREALDAVFDEMTAQCDEQNAAAERESSCDHPNGYCEYFESLEKVVSARKLQ